MLSLSNISYSYGAVRALQDVSMEMQPGQITCVMGRNGVGKTTLMKNIVGVLRSSAGTINLAGQNVTGLPPHKRVKSGIAHVAQGRQIFPKLTVTENLMVGCEARKDGKRIIPEELYELFPIIKSMGKRMGGDLSGGQQQQLAIARARVGEPKVLLLDEPTEGIQPNIIQQIGHVLKKLVTERNMTIVLVEQYLDFVREFGQRFYIMNRGRVVEQGATHELNADMIRHHLSV